MGLESLGVIYIDDELLENRPGIETTLDNKADELIAEAQAKFDDYLNSLGLECVMGFIRKKGNEQ